jgi:hypothetical protein
MLEAPLGKRGVSLQAWPVALLLTLAIIGVYISLVVWNDNTIVGTSNGLWKSVEVSAWSRKSGLEVDSGGIFYAAGYGRLSRLIPDSLVRYGVPAPDPTFRKMAILNAIFGGIASGLVLLLALRFTNSTWLAIVIALAHAGAGFVLVNSINSEDIIPAYAFFLAATFCFFEFLHLGGVGWFASSAALMAMATLFHWTLLGPALAAFGVVFAFLLSKGRKYFGQGLAWLFLFLLCVQALLLLAFPGRQIPLWAAVYPEKAGGGGWVGLLGNKGWFALVGMGNYFSGGFNVSNYRIPFENNSLLRLMIYSWTALLISLAACMATLLRRNVAPGLKLLAVAALALFTVGEMEATYSQPQDPQMQIEPMFIVIAGLILLAAVWRKPIAIGLLMVASANAYWNVHLIATRGRGGDSKAVAGIRELDRLFPKDQTMMVSQGFEVWVSWHFVLLRPEQFGQYAEHNMLLTKVFVDKRGISASDAAAAVEKKIDGAFAAGRRVIADSVWTDPLQDSVASFDTVTEEATARAFLSELKRRYRMGSRWETLDGPFVELLPASPGGNQPL